MRYDDLLHWLNEQFPDEDYVLIAESFSGPLAVQFASRSPPYLRGVVFVATFARSPSRLPIFMVGLAQAVPYRAQLLQRMIQPFVMGKWTNKDFMLIFQRALNNTLPNTMAGRLREVLSVNVVSQIAKIDIPFIYMRASRDRIVPARFASDFVISKQNVKTVDGPHFLLQANPRDCSKHILEFIEQLDA